MIDRQNDRVVMDAELISWGTGGRLVQNPLPTEKYP